MFCTKCGKEIDENASFCINCGQTVNKQGSQNEPFNQYNQTNGQFSGGAFNGGQFNGGSFNQPYGNDYNRQPYYVQPDAPSAEFAWLCFFFPIVGLILYIMWHDTYPMKARSCGKGALIGLITYVILVITIIIGFLSVYIDIISQIIL